MGNLFSSGMRDNIEAGLIVFAIDLVVTLFVLPRVLSKREKDMWRPMRKEIINELCFTYAQIIRTLDQQFKGIFSFYIACRDESQKEQRWIGTEPCRRSAESLDDRLKRTIDLLTPAIAPPMAAAIIDTIHVPSTIIAKLLDLDIFLSQTVDPLPPSETHPIARTSMPTLITWT